MINTEFSRTGSGGLQLQLANIFPPGKVRRSKSVYTLWCAFSNLTLFLACQDQACMLCIENLDLNFYLKKHHEI